MDDLTLPPATQAVLDALTELGRGTVHDLAERSGKARSTTDRAIKTLADAGLIVPADEQDDTDGAPTRWVLAATDAAPPPPVEDVDGAAAGTEPTEPEPADDDGATGDGALSEETPADGGVALTDAVTAARRTGDRRIMAIKAVLADHGEDGVTLEDVVHESGIGAATAARLLAAMQQADAARRVPADEENGHPERWVAGPTKASDVDPNPAPPRCPTCGQVIRTRRTPAVPLADRGDDVTVNIDGSRPFGRGELEQLTLAYLAERPGQARTPQEIAAGISAQLGGREVSNGAVRNNCTKAAASGRILLASESPLAFAYPDDTDN